MSLSDISVNIIPSRSTPSSFPFFFFNWNKLIYNVVLLSSVQQNKSVIHIHISTLFTILFHIDDYRVLREFSVLHSRSLLVIYFIHAVLWLVAKLSLTLDGLKPIRLFCPWGFSRQEYWSWLPCPPLGDLSKPEIEPRSPTLILYIAVCICISWRTRWVKGKGQKERMYLAECRVPW